MKGNREGEDARRPLMLDTDEAAAAAAGCCAAGRAGRSRDPAGGRRKREREGGRRGGRRQPGVRSAVTRPRGGGGRGAPPFPLPPRWAERSRLPPAVGGALPARGCVPADRHVVAGEEGAVPQS